MYLNPFNLVGKIKNLTESIYNKHLNMIVAWWNEHDSGALRWTNVSTNKVTFPDGSVQTTATAGSVSAPLTLTEPPAGNATALTVNQNDTTNNPTSVTINNAGTNSALNVVQSGNTPAASDTQAAVYVNNTANTGVGLSVYSNQAAQGNFTPLVQIHAANTAWNQPVLFIKHESALFPSTTIRIDSAIPAIAMVDTSQVAPAGKFQISDHVNTLRLEGRNAGNTAFDSIMVLNALSNGGGVYFGSGYVTASATIHGTGSTILGTANAIIPSANMGNGQTNIWVDEAANLLKFQVKYSTGVVKNGSITLV